MKRILLKALRVPGNALMAPLLAVALLAGALLGPAQADADSQEDHCDG